MVDGPHIEGGIHMFSTDLVKNAKTLAQAVNLYSSTCGDLPTGILSSIVLMLLDRVSPNDKQDYIKRMVELANQGYKNYVAYQKSHPTEDYGLPDKKRVQSYVTDCFRNNVIPSISGLCTHTDTSSKEAELLLQCLEKAWLTDTDYFTSVHLLECLSKTDTLQKAFTCFYTSTTAELSILRDKLAILYSFILEKNNEFTEYINSLKPFKDNYGKIYDYTSPLVPYIGREAELQKLTNFCNDKRKLLWWPITGNGGEGKSRLAFEFCKQIHAKGWKCLFLTRGALEKIVSFSDWSYPSDLLLVIDDATYYGQIIGAWIEKLYSNCTSNNERIRILFIERIGTTRILHDTASKDPSASSLTASWIKEIQRGIDDVGLLKYLCYSTSSINLMPLDDESLRRIVAATVNAHKGSSITESETSLLVSKIKEFDPELKRPLYLLFLVQMWLDDSNHQVSSNFTDLADFICDKELKRIQNIMGQGLPEDTASMLLIFATITHSFSIDDPNLIKIDLIEQSINNIAQSYSSSIFRSSLQRLFGENDSSCTVIPFSPSLIGEYFVLRTFLYKRHLIAPILQSAWKYDPYSVTIFLERVIVDFIDFPDNRTFYELFRLDTGIFQEPQIDNEVVATFYADLLVDLSAATKEPQLAIASAEMIQKFHFKYMTSAEIWHCHAMALHNLVLKPIAEIINIVGILKIVPLDKVPLCL